MDVRVLQLGGLVKILHLVEKGLGVFHRVLGRDALFQVLPAFVPGKDVVGPHEPLIRLHGPPDKEMLALKVRRTLGQGRRAFPEELGDAGIFFKMPARQIHGVAAEQLVRPFAGEDYLHIFGGVFR